MGKGDHESNQNRRIALGVAAQLMEKHPELMQTAEEIKSEESGAAAVVRVARCFERFLEGEDVEGKQEADGAGGSDQGPQV